MGLPGGGGDSQSPWTLLPMFGLMAAIMYFLMIRPQQKQKKEREALLAAVKTGDKVVTNGGLYGVVKGFVEETQAVKLEIATNVQVEVARSAITSVIGSTLVKKEKEKG
jgi:preprotein translocase subunit YajC